MSADTDKLNFNMDKIPQWIWECMSTDERREIIRVMMKMLKVMDKMADIIMEELEDER